MPHVTDTFNVFAGELVPSTRIEIRQRGRSNFVCTHNSMDKQDNNVVVVVVVAKQEGERVLTSSRGISTGAVCSTTSTSGSSGLVGILSRVK